MIGEPTGEGAAVAAEVAASAFLTALGIDVGQEALAETQVRMVKAYTELLTPASST